MESLTKQYRSGASDLTVFSGLEFTVADGESVAVVGESGAGKSSLLQLLGALDRPTSGRVWYGSRDIFALDDDGLADFRNRTIGFVWQMNSLLPEFNALENVMMPLLVRGTPRTEAAVKARERLDEIGLGARATHRPGELSGGEQQRVALARALVTGPRVLLADEPTGNLDFRTAQSIQDLLAGLQRSHRLTSVIVTHNLGFARSCDRILELERGTCVPWKESSAPAHQTASGMSASN
ncbi:MAG: ABC transporter ATP-binding protein [Bryobacteraceae bacterium]